MGRYDDISPEELRRQLVRYARLVLRREEEGTLLDSLPAIMRFLGELRQMVFAYEVRGARRDETGACGATKAATPDPALAESLKIVNQAIERARELQEELERGFLPEDSDDH